MFSERQGLPGGAGLTGLPKKRGEVTRREKKGSTSWRGLLCGLQDESAEQNTQVLDFDQRKTTDERGGEETKLRSG